jgi:DNA-binding XRE family transcriptional regulator
VRKIALTPVPSSGTSQGDFAHPTELLVRRRSSRLTVIGRRVGSRFQRRSHDNSAELVKARLRAGFSQVELAARMGISQSTIARLESGQTLPSTKTLLRYAQATGSKFRVRLSAA